MRFRRAASVWRTTAFRFAAIYTFVFAVAMALGLGSVYWGTIRVIEQQTDAAINSEIRALSERFQEGGLPALVQAVEVRTGPDAIADNVYLVVGPGERPVAGNLSRWPQIAVYDDWFAFPVSKRDGPVRRDRILRARAFELPNGFGLLVGRDSENQSQFRTLFFQAVFWIGGAALLFGLLAGYLLGRQVLRRVDRAARAGEAIAAGNLDSRVPVSGAGDEFDRLAESVNAMLDRIEGLMAGMRIATDSISHDVRRPLTRLRAQLEMAQAGQGSADEVMARATEEIDATVGILENLLRIARAEAGVPAGTWQELDLGAIVEDAVELYQPVAEERGIDLEAQIEPVMVRGEPQFLSQAVANLIDNALKYAPAGSGRVEVVVRKRDQACLIVRDNGPGIDEADRKRVTERFVRLDDARATEGSGLGLSLVRAVARMHGGGLTFRDNGPGLVAEISLPLADIAPAP